MLFFLDIIKLIKAKSFRLLINLPYIKQVAQEELAKVDAKILQSCAKTFEGEEFIKVLPEHGWSGEEICNVVKRYQEIGKIEWENGRSSGT